jgi:hypothetical protein
LFSRVWFEFSRWRWGNAEWKRYLLWLVVPLLAIAVGRLLLQRQWGRVQTPGTGGRPAAEWPGRDSEFYAIVNQLAAAGLARQADESGAAWLQRIRESTDISVTELEPLLAAHYRLRFHPAGLTSSKRAALRRDAARWLARHQESLRTTR